MALAYVQSHFPDDDPLKRLLIGLCLALAWPALAWGQAAEATQTAMKAADSIIATGPIGAIFVAYAIVSGVVIAALWKKGRDSDATIKELQDKRLADTAAYIERIAKVGTDASAAITGNNAQVADLVRLINAVFTIIQTIPEAVTSVKGEIVVNRSTIMELNNVIRDRLPGGGK